MNKEQYQALLLTRVLQGNGYGTVKKLVASIEAACQIPEETRWRDRKDAFNAISNLAPARGKGSLAISHSDIPAFLKSEWEEYNALKTMIRASNGASIDAVLARFWLTDADLAAVDIPCSSEEVHGEEPAPAAGP